MDLIRNEMNTPTQQNFVEPAIEFIRSQIEDADFNITVRRDWRSDENDYRLKIRAHMSSIDSSLFTRSELALLSDLTHLPKPGNGFVSISHCQDMGGYSFSKLDHGFDLETVDRISDNVIIRTSSPDEVSKCPHKKFLWVAKEAAFKALNLTLKNPKESLLITDIECKNWIQMNNEMIWSYQIKSTKSVNLINNIGFVFQTPTLFLAVFFR